MAREEELHKGLSDAVVDMDEDLARELAQKVVDEGFDAYEAIDKGLSAGMEEVGRLYEEEEYFIPELLLCSDAMYAGIEILKPHIKKREDAVRHTVVIGVVEGDTHDIGKNLVICRGIPGLIDAIQAASLSISAGSSFILGTIREVSSTWQAPAARAIKAFTVSKSPPRYR